MPHSWVTCGSMYVNVWIYDRRLHQRLTQMNWHCLLLMTPRLTAPSPSHSSTVFPSVIFLTPPKDDMEIHVSASLTMRSYKAIKQKKKGKKEQDWDLWVFVTVMSIDWWQRKRLRGPRQRGRGETDRENFICWVKYSETRRAQAF